MRRKFNENKNWKFQEKKYIVHHLRTIGMLHCSEANQQKTHYYFTNNCRTKHILPARVTVAACLWAHLPSAINLRRVPCCLPASDAINEGIREMRFSGHLDIIMFKTLFCEMKVSLCVCVCVRFWSQEQVGLLMIWVTEYSGGTNKMSKFLSSTKIQLRQWMWPDLLSHYKLVITSNIIVIQ